MPHYRSIFGIVCAVAAIPAAPCHAKDLTVSPEQIARLEVRLEEVRPAVHEAVAVLPATVIPALNQRVAATAPFAGTVVQVHVLPGQQIKEGDQVATVASRDLLEARGQLAQSEAELQAAIAVAQRKRFLADKSIANPYLAEEAEAQVAKIRAVVTQHKAAVSIGGIKASEGGRYTICAPAAGQVAETAAMTGEPIAAMASAVSIDTSKDLWLDVQLPAHLVDRLQVGDDIQVVDGPVGKVISIGRNIDKTTRSVRLLAAVPAGSGLLPGQMVKLSLLHTSPTGALRVPASAVAWIGGEYAVFSRSAEGFTVKPVSLRGKTLDAATISGDLAAGDKVAATGLPQLEAILSGN